MNREGSCWRGGQVMNHEGAVVGSTGVMIHDLTPHATSKWFGHDRDRTRMIECAGESFLSLEPR